MPFGPKTWFLGSQKNKSGPPGNCIKCHPPFLAIISTIWVLAIYKIPFCLVLWLFRYFYIGLISKKYIFFIFLHLGGGSSELHPPPGANFQSKFFNENHLFLTTWDSFSMKSIVSSAFLVRKHDFRDLKKIKLPPRGPPGNCIKCHPRFLAIISTI